MNTRMIQRRKCGKKELLAFKKGVIFTNKRLAKLAGSYHLRGKFDVFNKYFGTDIVIVEWWMRIISDSPDLVSVQLGSVPLSRNLHRLHLINQKIEQTLYDLS